MKKLFIFICILFLSGCTDVANYTLKKAEVYCKDHGGVYQIRTTLLAPNMLVTCGDGVYKGIPNQ